MYEYISTRDPLGSIPAVVNYTGQASDTSTSLGQCLRLRSNHRATGSRTWMEDSLSQNQKRKGKYQKRKERKIPCTKERKKERSLITRKKENTNKKKTCMYLIYQKGKEREKIPWTDKECRRRENMIGVSMVILAKFYPPLKYIWGCVWLFLQAQEENIYFIELAERVEYGNYDGSSRVHWTWIIAKFKHGWK